MTREKLFKEFKEVLLAYTERKDPEKLKGLQERSNIIQDELRKLNERGGVDKTWFEFEYNKWISKIESKIK